MTLRGGLARLAAVMLGIALGIAAAEVATRGLLAAGLLRAAPRFFRRLDPVLGHSLTPGASGIHRTGEFAVRYAINALGLRNPEIGIGKEAGARRILVLGDSFMEGHGVEEGETTARRLEALLGESFRGGRTEVVNAGVESYSPLVHWLFLRRTGLALHPDHVLLFYDWSDAADDLIYHRFTKRDPAGSPVSIAPGTMPMLDVETNRILVARIAGRSRLRSFLTDRSAIGRVLLSTGSEASWTGTDLIADRLGGYRPHEGTADQDRYLVTREWVSAEDRMALLGRSLEALTGIRDLLGKEGIPLTVVLYPYAHQVHPTAWSGRVRYGLESGRVYPADPFAQMEAALGERGIAAFSLLPAFKAEADRIPSLYYDQDGHWTAAGHEVAARAVASQLATNRSDPATGAAEAVISAY